MLLEKMRKKLILRTILIAPFVSLKWIRRTKNWRIAALAKNISMLSVSKRGRTTIPLVPFAGESSVDTATTLLASFQASKSID